MLYNRYVYFLLLAGWVLVGCSSSSTTVLGPTSCKAQIIEKQVIAGCPIQEIDCDFSGENFEPTRKLLECVKLQKVVLEQCAKVTTIEPNLEESTEQEE